MKIYTGKDKRLRTSIGSSARSYPIKLLEQKLCRKLILGETVDHIDGDPTNNSPENLRVLNRSTNAMLGALGNKHCLGYKQTESHKRSGEKNGQALFTQEQVRLFRLEWDKAIGKAHKNSVKHRLMKEYNVSRKTVENILSRVTYK